MAASGEDPQYLPCGEEDSRSVMMVDLATQSRRRPTGPSTPPYLSRTLGLSPGFVFLLSS